jgi:hypothetical protein
VSLAKSVLRVWAGGLLLRGLVPGAGLLLVLAEFLGVVEELVV